MNTKHTPPPWYVDPTDAEGRTVSTASSNAIAECGLDYSSLEPRNGRANAAHIVRCVNAHDELVAALRLVDQADGLAQSSADYEYKMAEALTAVRAALAKVDA